MNQRTRVPHNLLWAKVLFVILSCVISSEIGQASVIDPEERTSVKRTNHVLDEVSVDQENICPLDDRLIRETKRTKCLIKKEPQRDQKSLVEEICWNFLARYLPRSKYEALLDSMPCTDDLKGFVKGYISTALLKRDPAFSVTSLTPEEQELLNILHVPFYDLALNIEVTQTICSPVKSPSSFRKSTHLTSPLLRGLVSRLGMKSFRENGNHLRQPVFATRQDLVKTREQTHRDIEDYIRALKEERARAIQEQKELHRIEGLTRSAAQRQLQSLREGGTQRVFTDFICWLGNQKQSELSRSEINEYFIAHMAFLFNEVQVGGLRFFYNPLDISTNLTDSRERSNPERLFLGLNAIYETRVEEGSFRTKQRNFDWHHIAQEQLPHGSIVVCIPQEIHHNPLLHPFNDEGSQIDRHLFSMLKREANMHIAQTTVH